MFAKKYITKVGIVIALFSIWLLIADAYRSSLKQKYSQCIFEMAPNEAKLSLNIYEHPDGIHLRRNCAEKIGDAFEPLDSNLIVDQRKFSLWQQLVLLPMFFISDVIW
jgi:hypothetical protein